MKRRIVVADDDPKILGLICQALAHAGFVAEPASDGREAVRMLAEGKPDLAILDWDMPGMTGLQVCQFLKTRAETGGMPVLMLTVFSGTRQKVSALDSGADDYLTKPFDVEELLARVRALLRRNEPGAQPAGELRCGPIRMNVHRHLVTVSDQPVELRPKEFELLHALLVSPGRVLSRRQLVEKVWGMDAARVAGRAIDSHIARLRTTLGKEAAGCIETVPGFGYRAQDDSKSKRP